MRIAIMGAGGIGGYIGARLAHSKAEVTFVGRGAHLEAMKSTGLRLKSPLGDASLERVNATDQPKEVGIADIIIFAVKLYDSEAAAAALSPMIGPQSRVITLQNGIDSVDILARYVPRRLIVGGVTYISAFIERPGTVVHPGGITLTKIEGASDAVVQAFRAATDQALGIDLKVVENVEDVIWYKFVTICAFSGATTLLRAPIGPILSDAPSKAFLEQLRDEGVKVAQAAGHHLPENYAEEVETIWRKLAPNTRSSMANDLNDGKPIELAWLSGRMHELGVELGVGTPAHTAVLRALHLHINGHLRSGGALHGAASSLH